MERVCFQERRRFRRFDWPRADAPSARLGSHLPQKPLGEVEGGGNVLFMNLVHSGEAVLNREANLDEPGALRVGPPE